MDLWGEGKGGRREPRKGGKVIRPPPSPRKEEGAFSSRHPGPKRKDKCSLRVGGDVSPFHLYFFLSLSRVSPEEGPGEVLPRKTGGKERISLSTTQLLIIKDRYLRCGGREKKEKSEGRRKGN